MPPVPSSNLTSQSVTTTSSPTNTYRAALWVVTTLFFMWGFLTCLNDILVPHLKSIFDLNYFQVMLIQFAFFSAYFIFSIPSAKVVDWIGYKKTMVAGLFTMGLGSFLFIPAASVPSYPLFLGALIVLAAGITKSRLIRTSRCLARRRRHRAGSIWRKRSTHWAPPSRRTSADCSF